jgi:hypothetical protein
LITIVIPSEPTCGLGELSVTFTVTANEPTTVGVPPIVPLVGFIDNPAGRPVVVQE